MDEKTDTPLADEASGEPMSGTRPQAQVGGTTMSPSQGGLAGDAFQGDLVRGAVMADDWGPVSLGTGGTLPGAVDPDETEATARETGETRRS